MPEEVRAVHAPPPSARSDNVLWQWWRETFAAGVDHEGVVRRVSEESGWTPRYCFMILISAAMSILGLLLPSSAVLIGAMLISPLMMPIIGLGFGLATFDFAEVRRAALALALGSAIAILFSAIFVAFSPLQTVTNEIALRTRPNLFDLMVAILSALAGVYALVRGLGGAVVGVAIAIALMPPLAVVGFGIATANWTAAGGAALLFVTNLVAMAATAALHARLYGFGGHLSPAQTRLQGVLLVGIMLVLAVPLGIALRQIAWESVAQRQIRDAILLPFPDGARVSQIDIDFDAEPIVVRALVLTPEVAGRANQTALLQARQAVRRPIDLRIDQVRVGGETGAGDAAQIAAARGAVAERNAARVAERLALIAGVPAERVLVDRVAQRALVKAEPLPGADLAAYRLLEQRVARGEPGWAIELVPPVLPPAPVTFGEDGPDEAGAASLATALWAARRLGLAVAVSGADDEAVDMVLAAFADAGLPAGRVPGGGGDVALAWRVEAPPAE